MVIDGQGPVLYCCAEVNALETCGRYELVRRLAVGGMAEIYLARETGLAGFERLVIVKRILPNLAADTDFIDMFLDEARLAARLSHPNIVHIYELGEHEGTYFIAMEYVPGGDLHELLARRRGVLPPLDDSLHVVSEVCAGLQFAHALAGPDGTPLGVVHRDVTPKNVLLSVDGVVKVMDFGIAKARAKLSVTRPGDIKGTFSYMAPEQARGERVDRRADIYAVGTLLYRLMTGTPAYPQTGNALLAAVRAGQFVRPRKVNPELPPVIEDVILRAMSLEPKDRFATCGALRRDLGEAARSLGLHGDSESLAAMVRESFPSVPGATVPVEAPGALAVLAVPKGTAVETPVRQALAPAGPEESTGLLALDDLDVLEARPIEEAGGLDSPLEMDATDMVLVPRTPPPRVAMVDLIAPRSDPAARLPTLMDDDSVDEPPTNVVEYEVQGDDDPTRALQTPEAAAASAPPVGPAPAFVPAPVPPAPAAISPIPPAPPEPRVIIGPATPTATPFLRPSKKAPPSRSRRGTVLIAVAFFAGAVMIAAAITLAVMPGPPVGAAVAAPGAAPLDPPLGDVALPEIDPPLAEVGAPPLEGRLGDASALAPPPIEPLPEPVEEPPPIDLQPTKAAPPPADEPAREPPPSATPPHPREPATKVRDPEPRFGVRPSSRDEGAGEPSHTKERAAPATGFLTVWTTPYSKVYLGSKLLGTTPMAKREVPAGPHRLKLVNPELPQKVVPITVRPGEVTRVRERL